MDSLLLCSLLLVIVELSLFNVFCWYILFRLEGNLDISRS